MSDHPTVAVLGAGGTMGFPMARNIARAGIPVRAWNRTPEKARPLSEDGAEILDSAAEAVEGAAVIITMMADTDAVIGSVQPALARAQDDAIWVQMSTIGEAGIERCAQLAGDRGIALIDAPVLGTKQPAQEGKLVVLASGPEDSRGRVQPIFDAVGQKTLWIGAAGSGTRMKMVANSWVLTVVEGCAETIALAQGLQLDPQLLFEAIEGGPLDLPYLRMKGQAILKHDFEPAFRLKLAAKDAALIRESADDHDLDLPLFTTIATRMAEAAREHGDEDMIATYFASAPTGTPA